LDELQKELSESAGIDVSISTVWRALARLGITYKKVSYIESIMGRYANCARTGQLDKRAMERNEGDRAEYRRLIRAFRPRQLAFADESSFNRKGTYKDYGFALSSDRACKKAFHVRGKRLVHEKQS
jgi:hypothetical protein